MTLGIEQYTDLNLSIGWLCGKLLDMILIVSIFLSSNDVPLLPNTTSYANENLLYVAQLGKQVHRETSMCSVQLWLPMK